MVALSEERERAEAAMERAVQRTTDIVQQGMNDLKKVGPVLHFMVSSKSSLMCAEH